MRRVRVLLDGLPVSSRTWREENGGWTTTDHLLASNVEWTNAVYRAVLASIPQPTTRTRKLPDPLVITRPGMKKKQPRRVSPLEFMAMARG